MTEHFVNWLRFNLVFSLLPLGAVLVTKMFMQTLTFDSLRSNSHELLFVALMAAASTASDIAAADSKKKLPLNFTMAKAFVETLAFVIAIIYGIVIAINANQLATATYQVIVFRVTIVIVISVLVVSIPTQVNLGKHLMGVGKGRKGVRTGGKQSDNS